MSIANNPSIQKQSAGPDGVAPSSSLSQFLSLIEINPNPMNSIPKWQFAVFSHLFGYFAKESPRVSQSICVSLILFCQDLLPHRFLIIEYSRLSGSIAAEHRQSITVDINRIATCSSVIKAEIFERSIKNPLNSPFFVLNSSVFIPDSIKFLVSSRVVLSDLTRYSYMIKCLLLFGSQVISLQTASLWIRLLSPELGSLFDSLPETRTPILFHPHSIYEFIKKTFSLEQIAFILGSFLNKYFESEPPKPFEYDLKAELKRNEEISIAPEVAELQARKNLEIVHTSASLMRISTSGNSQIANEFKMAMTKGKVSFGLFLMELNFHLSALDRLSSDWRILYGKRMKGQTILMDLIFNGFSADSSNQNALKCSMKELKELLAKFEIDSSILDQFYELFTPKSFYFDVRTARTLYYLCAIVRLFGSESYNEKNHVSEVVFSNSPPYCGLLPDKFCGIDILLLNFAKSVGKFAKGEKVAVESAAELISYCNLTFLFRSEIENGRITVRSFMNPSVVDESELSAIRSVDLLQKNAHK